MKKKLLTILLTLAAVLCLCFAFTACDNGGSGNSATDSGSTTEQGGNGATKPDEGGSTKPDEGGTGGSTKPDEGGTTKPDEHIHSFTDYVYNNDATCTETDTREVKDSALGHDYQQYEAKPATCADAGYEAYEVCQRCNDSTFKGYIPAMHVQYRLNNEAYTVSDLSSDCSDGEIVIPETYMGKPVTSIGENAFSRCSKLKSITIPDSVTTIGENAFYGCSGLKSIEIPNSVTSIGAQAFLNCYGLMRVYIDDLTAWCEIDFGGYANPLLYAQHLYLDNMELKELTIPNEITEIKPFAFCGFSEMTSINIHDNVTSIGEAAFEYCYGLTSITIPDSVTSIGWSAFGGCSSLERIEIPDSVTIIGGYTFSGCSGLTSITIPASLTSIGDRAFEDCECLPNIVWNAENCVKAGSDYDTIFYGCTNLSKLNFGDNVKTIPDYAFRGCSSIENITFPDSMISIGEWAFYGCSSIESITIPDSVTSIGRLAFDGCNKIIQKKGNVQHVGQWAIDCDSSVTETVLRAGTKGIADSAFNGCMTLRSISIPESVLYIGQYAFRNCPLESVTVQGNATWQVAQTSDFANAETVDITDPAQYVDYFTFDYLECYWKRSV